MKRLSARSAAVVGVMLLFGVNPARADFVDWSYSWSLGQGQGPTFTSGTSTVALALAASAGTGGPTIPAGNFTSNSAAGSPADTFNTHYDVTLGLTDNPSHAAHNFVWQGTITGSLSATHSSLVNTFNSPLTQTFTLGSHQYQVTIDPSSTNINAPGGAPTLIDALVVVSNATGGGNGGGGGPPPKTPEPSTWVLAGSALALFGLARWRSAGKALQVA
jgi:hypothetical protein